MANASISSNPQSMHALRPAHPSATRRAALLIIAPLASLHNHSHELSENYYFSPPRTLLFTFESPALTEVLAPRSAPAL